MAAELQVGELREASSSKKSWKELGSASLSKTHLFLAQESCQLTLELAVPLHCQTIIQLLETQVDFSAGKNSSTEGGRDGNNAHLGAFLWVLRVLANIP